MTVGALVLTVVLVAFGSSAAPTLRDIGAPGRWPALIGLWVCAVILARSRRHGMPGRPLLHVTVPAAALLVLALLSAGWSSVPHLTLGRSVALGIALSAAFLLAYAVERDSSLVELLLLGVVVAAAIIALGGALVYAAWPEHAVQGATPLIPPRWRGVGENPNTISMLAAVALPAAAPFAASDRWPFERAVGWTAVVGLTLTIFASGSRGALLAALIGLLVTATFRRARLVRRLALAGSILAVALAGVVVTDLLAKPSGTIPTAPGPAKPGSHEPEPAPHSLGSLNDSGRLEAWKRALQIAKTRPVLGFGFGTEERVFVNRLHVFAGSRPENSFLGLLLQLGVVGAALLLAAIFAVLNAAVRAYRKREDDAAALVGVCAAAAVLLMVQSYIYSAGNVAMVTVWIAAFMLGAVASRRHA